MARNKSNTRRRKAAHKRPVYGYCVRVTCDVHVGGTGPARACQVAEALVREAIEATGNAVGIQQSEARWRVGE